jgi:hypothetical protein
MLMLMLMLMILILLMIFPKREAPLPGSGVRS